MTTEQNPLDAEEQELREQLIEKAKQMMDAADAILEKE